MNRNSEPNTAESPVAIIAGNGMLPLEIAHSLETRSIPFHIIGFEGEADQAISSHPHSWCAWEKIGRLFKLLKTNGCKRVVLAGGVVGRPEFKLAKLDWGGVLTLPGFLSALLSGDNAVLTSVISIFEKRGYEVCNVAELVPEIVVQPGANTSLTPKMADIGRIAEGAAVAAALGKFDIGQGCVVVGKRSVAVEGAEGTDGMLLRIVEMRTNNRLPQRKGGVLVKSVKPGQDERADLPAIGPDTISGVHRAGLTGIGVEAGKTLIIDKKRTLELARELKIFIYGFDPACAPFKLENDG